MNPDLHVCVSKRELITEAVGLDGRRTVNTYYQGCRHLLQKAKQYANTHIVDVNNPNENKTNLTLLKPANIKCSVLEYLAVYKSSKQYLHH